MSLLNFDEKRGTKMTFAGSIFVTAIMFGGSAMGIAPEVVKTAGTIVAGLFSVYIGGKKFTDGMAAYNGKKEEKETVKN